MKGKPATMEGRLRLASTFVFIGLCDELISLLWAHPTAFIVFVFPGGLLIALGVAVYLYSLVSIKEPAEREAEAILR